MGIISANDRIQVGILDFSDRFRSSLRSAFLKYADEMNFEFVSVCDLWNHHKEKRQSLSEGKNR